MHILYLHQYFVPPEASGGTRSYELARRWVAAGHQVTLVTSNAMMGAAYRSLTEPTTVDVDGIRVIVLPVPYSNHMSYAERMLAFAKFAGACTRVALSERADVVFATSTPLTIAVPGLLASAGHRVPMVFEVRDLWPELPIAMGALRNPLMRGAASMLEWCAYHGASRVVALSPAIADGVVRRGIPREHVSVVSNACDLQAFSGAADGAAAARSRHLGALGADAKVVLYGGTFGAINDVAWLADVAAASRYRGDDLHFVLVGDGAGRDALIQRATNHGVLDQNLHVLAPIPKREIPGLLGAATIATSLFMPLPEMEANSANKFFDALAAGKPIAINYGGWHADLLEEWGAGIALPHAQPMVAAARLADLAMDPTALADHGAAALRLARSCFDRDALAAQVLRVLCDAAALGPADSGLRAIGSRATGVVRSLATKSAAAARRVTQRAA